MNIRNAVKNFYNDNKTEIAFLAGAVVTAAILVAVQSKDLKGMKNVAVSEYINRTNDDHLIVVQQANGHMDTFTIHPIADTLVS